MRDQIEHESPSADDAYERLIAHLTSARFADMERVRGMQRRAADREVRGSFTFSTLMVKRLVRNVQEPLGVDPGQSQPMELWARDWPPDTKPPQNATYNERQSFDVVDCAACSARGELQCPTCQGRGTVPDEEKPHKRVRCRSCMGEGTIKCKHCSGAGRFRRFKQVEQVVTKHTTHLRYPDDDTRVPKGNPTGQLHIEQPLGHASFEEVAKSVDERGGIGEDRLRRWVAAGWWSERSTNRDAGSVCGWVEADGRWFNGWRLTCAEGGADHTYFVPDGDVAIVGPALRDRKQLLRVGAAIGLLAVSLGIIAAVSHQREVARLVTSANETATFEAFAAATAERRAWEASATAERQAGFDAVTATIVAQSSASTAVALATVEAEATLNTVVERRTDYAVRIQEIEAAVSAGEWRDAKERRRGLADELAPTLAQGSPLEGSDWLRELDDRLVAQSNAIATLEREDIAQRRETESARRAPVAQAPSGLGDKRSIVAGFQALGFSGSESPLASGTQRWMGQRSRDSAGVDVIGPDNAIQKITVIVVASEEAGMLIGAFLTAYAPGSNIWFQEVLGSYTGADLNEKKSFGDRNVRVMTATTFEGGIVLVTVEQE